MGSFLENVGLIAICFVIIFGCKKILEYCDLKQSNFYENDRVYKAADEFAHGAAADEVKALLAGCLDFDEEDAKEILSRSFPHRTDKDGGYRSFIESVNKVLGEDVYSEQCHTH